MPLNINNSNGYNKYISSVAKMLTIKNDEEKTDKIVPESEERTDTITISDEARAAQISEQTAEAEETNEEHEVTEGKTTVTFNAEKRARQLAAAKNADEVRVVLALLSEDLSDCEAGLKTGGCDEEEVEKVKRMIARAKERLSQVSDQPEKEDENTFDAFDIAMLM